MQNIVILGAGTGGAIAANLLAEKLDLRRWSITVIDRGAQHVYQPGLLFLPLSLYGYDRPEDLVRPIAWPLPKAARLLQADVKLIDHERRSVETDAGPVPYDWLISALGCRLAPEEVEGMAEALGHDGVHTFYALEGARAMQQAMAGMRSGRLVIDIADMPIKCPVAPIEFAFLADYYFELEGVRDDVEIVLVTPFSGAFTKPNANRVLTEIAARKRIEVVGDFAIESVDAAGKVIKAFDGKQVEYDLLCAIPPNFGPQVVEDSGLGDGTGYVLTDPRTLAAKRAERVFVLGDNSNVSASKAGSVAHFEAETVVENLLRAIDGKAPLPSFDGHANCFIESGHHKALLIDFNYDMEPLEGDFPLPYVGPFSLLEESYVNHLGKLAFKWVYWHMLLKGRLPNVPLLPSHMSFLGKRIATAPQVRRSVDMQVGDVMTREVVTVTRGTPLSQAASTMLEHKVSGLPVLDVDGRLIGIVTESDFLSALDTSGLALADVVDTVIRKRRARRTMGTIVDDIMTRDPITIGAEETLQNAVRLMDNNRVKRLAVIDAQGGLAGILARADLIKLFALRN